MLYHLVRFIVRPLLRLAWRLQVRGRENLPPGAAIVVANHDSLADPFVVGAAIDRRLRYLAKSELWSNWLVGHAMDALGGISVTRHRGDVAAVDAAAGALAQGETVVIFPQGTVLGGEGRAWQRGAARLALTTGAPLVPVAIVGAAHGLRPGTWLPRRTCVSVVIGEALAVDAARVTIPATRALTVRLRAAVEALPRA